MTEKTKKFIQDNKDLIDLNTKESWEEIYSKLPLNCCGEFTEIILECGINDPVEIMGYVPESYLGFSKIKNYVIPNKTTHIGYGAFSGCHSLTSVTIPDSVTSIGNYAFESCESLTSITIPNRVTSIGDRAFRECSSLTNIIFNGTKTQWDTIKKGDSWTYGVPAKKVICSDGGIAIK